MCTSAMQELQTDDDKYEAQKEAKREAEIEARGAAAAVGAEVMYT